jgi:hypothetical protein
MTLGHSGTRILECPFCVARGVFGDTSTFGKVAESGSIPASRPNF